MIYNKLLCYRRHLIGFEQSSLYIYVLHYCIALAAVLFIENLSGFLQVNVKRPPKQIVSSKSQQLSHTGMSDTAV